MVVRYIEQRQAVFAALDQLKSDHLTHIQSSDFEVLQHIADILKPFAQVTTIISGEQYPTVSLIAPLKHKLLEQLTQPSASLLIRSLKEEMVRDLENRYNTTAEVDFLNHCSFMDPRFKNMKFLSEGEKRYVIAGIKEEVVNVCCNNDRITQTGAGNDNSTSTSRPDDDSVVQADKVNDHVMQPPSKKSLLDDFFGDSYNNATTKEADQVTETLSMKISREVDFYCLEDTLNMSDCPLD